MRLETCDKSPYYGPSFLNSIEVCSGLYQYRSAGDRGWRKDLAIETVVE